MKKPSKPTPPHEPKAPTRSYDETWPSGFALYHESIARVLDRVNQQIVNWRGMRTDCVFADPNPDDIMIELDHDGYGSDDQHIEAKWGQKVTITMTDAQWAAAQVKHVKALGAYAIKLAFYQEALTQYDKNLAVYEAERLRAIESRDRETLARLRAKYPKA